MVNLIFNYLLESSLCLILFLLTYRILIAELTNFSWMRFYLLASMALSLILPLIIIPVEWSAGLIPADPFPHPFLMPTERAATAVANHTPDLIRADPGTSMLRMFLFFAFAIYMTGVVYRSCLLVKNLMKMNDLIKRSSKVKEENYWVVCLKSELPAFSFFNYIFINNTYKNLSSDELLVIKKHELAHVKQYHTLDILFAELMGIFFWFNPIVSYLKRSLKEIHEYIVDERIAGHGGNTKKAYAQLLLTLASDAKAFDLAASFTGEPIKRRIQMLAKPRTSPISRLMFIILAPLAAFLLLSFSYLKKPEAATNANSCREQNEVTGSRPELKKYCGVYLPSKRAINSGLKPVEIILKNNKLFANGTIELQFESDSLFSYADNSARSIQFELDGKKEVTGCAFVKFVTKGRANYLVLEGEYLKAKR